MQLTNYSNHLAFYSDLLKGKKWCNKKLGVNAKLYYNMRIILIITIFLMSTFNIYSCSCIGKSSVKNSFENNDLIVVGKVLERKEVKIYHDTFSSRTLYNKYKDTLDKMYGSFEKYLTRTHTISSVLEFKIVITKSYKETHLDTVYIRTGYGHGDCGFMFEIGREYLIYGENYTETIYTDFGNRTYDKTLSGTFRTNICTRTKLLSEAEDETDILDQLK
jgi:hypothetical protein